MGLLAQGTIPLDDISADAAAKVMQQRFQEMQGGSDQTVPEFEW